MKKLLTMAFVAIIMMTSCSDDDSSNTNNPDPSGPLLNKIISTYDGESVTTNFHYDGNRITGYNSSDGYSTEFTYTGGKLTKMEAFADDELIQRNTYEYHANGKLAQHIAIDYYDFNAVGIKKLYTHNDNNTISVEVYTGDDTAQTTLGGSATVTMSNGNIVLVSVDSGENEGSTTYTFDDKNSPFKNVFASDILNLSELSGGVNNVLTETDSGGTVYETFYTYNADGYPVTSSDTWDGEPNGDYEYFYE